jgi:hypothetical protein
MRNDDCNQHQNREFHHDGYHPDRNPPAEEVSGEPQVVDLGKLASSTHGIGTIPMGADHGQ